MIVLASNSPRRRELLGKVVADFVVAPSNAAEHSDSLSVTQYVADVSLLKASDVATKYPDAVVIGCDTIVVHNGVIFGKPKSPEDATRMLSSLSAATHQVYTGVTLIKNGSVTTFVERTDVTFRPLTSAEIAKYIAGGSCFDKAGAYGIQDTDFVAEIVGSYHNVMGLPVEKLRIKLQKLGVAVLQQ
jgi:septum formation protein